VNAGDFVFAAVPARIPASRLLGDLVDNWRAERIRLRDVVDVLGDRAYGLLFLLFALPNTVPSPFVGQSGVCGVPLIFLTAQLMIGLPHPWLPSWLGDRSMPTIHFAAGVRKAIPWLQRMERLLQPRLRWVCKPGMQKLLALLCVVLAIVLALPIPLGNIPPAISISLIALGLIEHDGIAIGIGVVAGAGSLVIASAVVGSMVAGCLYVLGISF
jgi:hypothetical protein